MAARGNSAPIRGDVLFSKDGTVGKVHVVADETPFAVLSSIAILRPRPEIVDSSYMGHALRSAASRAQANLSKTGSALRRIILKDLNRLRFPLPPINEQRRIAMVLDKSTSILRRRRESVRLLDLVVRSTFLEIFGDPGANDKRWEVARLGNVVREAQYGTSVKAHLEPRGLPVLRMGNITQTGELDLSHLKWCEIPAVEQSKYTVKRGDLLFNRTNSPELVGKTAVWDQDDTYAFAGYLIRVRFDSTRVLPEYVSAYLNSAFGKRLLFARAKASNNMSNISASELKRLPLPIPPLALQQRFVGVLARAAEVRKRLVEAANTSQALFDSLSQQAFA